MKTRPSRQLARRVMVTAFLLAVAVPVQGQEAFRKAIRTALPSVVKIASGRRSLFRRRTEFMAASGVVVSADGYIVSCASVLGKSRRVTVTLPDGSKTSARIVRTDASADLVILRVSRKGLRPITMHTAGLPGVGQWVVTIGNPFGLARTRTDSLSASVGVVSAVRPVTARDFTYTDPVVLTDIAVNPGGSG
ncbi:unnamed protein product, partial [marine sediment metagenome]